jgi:hypothetical protein
MGHDEVSKPDVLEAQSFRESMPLDGELAPRLIGHLSCNAGIAEGWVRSAESSDPKFLVATVDGTKVWQGLADQIFETDRDDGEVARQCDIGAFGFRFLLPEPPGGCRVEEQMLRVCVEDGRDIPGSPLRLSYGERFIGYVEAIHTASASVEVVGWLIDKRAPSQVTSLTVCYAGKSLRLAQTGISRPDLLATGYDAPNGGFRFVIPRPDHFDHQQLRIFPGRSATPLGLMDDASLTYEAETSPSTAVPALPLPPHRLAHRLDGPAADCVVEGYIDRVTPAGLVSGWAHQENQTGPVGVELWLEGEFVAAATAAAFRRDLLTAGVGHGHYGFDCWIRPRAARHGVLQLRISGRPGALAEYKIDASTPLGRGPAKIQTVEALLERRAQWSMDDVERNLGALDLSENYAKLGPRRFIARVYRFLLGRWPDATEYDFYLNDLSRGLIGAVDIFSIVNGSDERKRSSVAPLSPFDPRFPLFASNRRHGRPG